MIYVTGSSITINCAIPSHLSAYTVQANFHAEVVETTTGIKRNYQAASVTPAVASSAEDPDGTPGLVVFNGVSVPEDESFYFCTVFYANNGDLDANGVEINRVSSGTFKKVTTTATAEF